MIYLYVFQIFVLLVSVAAIVNIKSPEISDRRFHSGTKDGKRRNSDSHIVGGYKANATDFPYIATVLHIEAGSMLGFCAGTLIRPNHVLTFATCLKKRMDGKDEVLSKDQLGIFVGSDSFYTGGEAYPVDGVSIPKKYQGRDSDAWEADIAVLAIGNNFQFNQTVSPVNLPKSQYRQFLNNLQAKGAECVVANWVQRNTFMAVKVNLIKTSYCRQLLEKRGTKISDEFHVCTYTEGKSPCIGDGGSGLICGSGDSAYVCGIAFFSPDCGKYLPTVYTRVDAYYNFIEKALKGETLLEDTMNSSGIEYSTLSTIVITVCFELSLIF